MWVEWLEDEEKLLFGALEEISSSDSVQPLVDSVLALFDKAIKEDYRYYKVCRRFCKFVLRLYHH
jgi:anti-sigma factor ChrR (cupin superfamily)